MQRYSLIVNPVAGKGHGAEAGLAVESYLKERGCSVEVLRSERRGHAIELARRASGEVVVGVGGDGTMNEVANGLVGTGKTFGVIPAGSGNDFVKSVGIPKETQAALEVLLTGTTRMIDIGYVGTGDSEVPPALDARSRVFINGIGIGFDAAVAAKVPEIRVAKGFAQYIVAVFLTLGKYRSPRYRVTTDGKAAESRHLLMAIGNGTCAGGGFYLTPDAVVDDGLFDLCLVDDVGLGTILRLMPLVLLGKHRHQKCVKFSRFKEMTVSADGGFYVHADGEIVGREVRSVALRLEPAALRVISGETWGPRWG